MKKKKSKYKRYALPKGMHPFEEEFFQSAKPDFENQQSDISSLLGPIAPETISITDIDFSDIDGSDFKTGLKRLNGRMKAQENYNKKLNRGRKWNGSILSSLIDESSSAANGTTHNISIPEDRPVIIEGQSKYPTDKNVLGDTLAEVTPEDFKKGLNSYAATKINAAGNILTGNSFIDDLNAYQKTKGPTIGELQELLGETKSSHSVSVPNDREVIIEGKSNWQQIEQQQTQDAINAAKADNSGNSTTISTPEQGLGMDNLPPMINDGASHNIFVPEDRELIVEGVSRFILSDEPEDNEIKAMQYYKGKKLNHMTLTFNNDSQLDFNVELFNPTLPLQYLIGTRLNIDDKIQIAGGTTTYSEMIAYLIGNPTMIISAQIVVSTPSGTITDIQKQFAQNFLFKNKSISGYQAIEPINVALARDIMQAQPDIVYFNIPKQLNRPFVVDGLDTITYKILAGNTVTVNFYYKQVQMKRVMFEECREALNLL